MLIERVRGRLPFFPNKKAQACLFGSITLSTLAYALPEGESVIRGQVDFNKSSHEWMIQQHTHKAVVDYQKFSVDKNERIEFVQPSTKSVMLNRVVGGDMSNILGTMQSNGKIFLVNPSGIIFGKDATINVGGLVASTLNIDVDDFMNGNYAFDIEKNANAIAGAIQQQGIITAQEGGFIILLSPHIQQQGMLIAHLGRVELASADAAKVSLDFTDLPAVSLTKASWKGWIDQHGKIDAKSGVVRLTVASAMDLLSRAVQPKSKQANTIVEKDGRLFLVAEDEKNPHVASEIRQTGEITAQRNNSKGGTVQIQADYIQHAGTIDVSAKKNNAGNIDLKAHKALTLESKSLLKADAMQQGDGGEIIAKAPQTIFRTNAFISAEGGESFGDGGFVEVSGFNLVEIFGEVSTYSATGKQGQFLIDPRDVTISAAAQDNNSFLGNTYTPSGAGSNINVNALTASLRVGDVIVTTDDGGMSGENGDITVSAAIDFDGTDGNTLTLIADRNININANMADLTPNVIAEATNVILDAQDDIFMQAGRVIDAGSGTIRMSTAIGNINLASIQTENATSTAIALISGGSIIDANAGIINITANTSNARTSITAPSGTDELEILLDELILNVDNSTALIQASGDIDIAGISSTNLLGDINLTLENGGATFMSAALGGAGAQITGSGDLNIILETLDLNSNNILNINHTLAYTGTGNIIFDHQGGDIVFSNLGRITNTAGDIDLTTSVGEINMADGSFIRATLGQVSLSSFNDMFIRQVVSGSSANDSIELNITGTGNFEDAGNTTTASGSADLISTTGGVSILGGNNVVQLETQIARLESSSVNLVDVFLNEVDSITVADLTTTAGGGIQIISGGDISVGEINSAGVVTLTSGGGILDAGDDTITDITAPNIVLSAAQKIGDLTGDIIGTADELDVDTTSISLTLTNELSAGDVNEIAIRQTSIAGTGNLAVTQLVTPNSANAARVSISSELNGVDLTAINWVNALDSTDFLRVSALDNNATGAGNILLGNLNTTLLAGLALAAVNQGQDILVNSTQSDLSTMTLNVTDFLLKSGTSERIALTGATDVDGFITGGNLSITSANALNVLDLDEDNLAISVEGNFAAQVTAGDLNLSDTIVASDILNDNIRSGTLDFTVLSGNIFAGTGASVVQIISLNAVDQDATSTLSAAANTSADSDIAIRMRVMDSSQSIVRNITLGNDTGIDDTIIRAQGGDIYLSAGEAARGTDVNLREFTVGTDVAITAFDDVLDAETGTGILDEVNITAPSQLVVRAGRVVDLTSKNLGGSLIDLTDQEKRDITEQTEETTRPIPPPEPVVTQTVAFDNRYLGLVSEACLGQNPTSASSTCRQEIAMRQFLNAFLLDGQVPPIKSRSQK
ncbi:MAG: filamentous hemagglutinin N-terminal domain-containing protein [Pseudomonadota bacterium]